MDIKVADVLDSPGSCIESVTLLFLHLSWLLSAFGVPWLADVLS